MASDLHISVVTPVLNAAGTLAATMESIASQDVDVEHVVCDAGSTDESVAIARAYQRRHRVRVLQVPGKGLYESIALGHDQTSGEIMAWLNGDDFYHPGALRTVEHVFKTCPRIDWICGIPNQLHLETGVSVLSRRLPVYSPLLIRLGLYQDAYLGYLQQESMFWRRSLYDRAGGRDILNRYQYAGDFHLWRAFARHARLRTVRSVLASFTVRSGQLSRARRACYMAESGRVLQFLPVKLAGRMLHASLSLLASRRIVAPHQIA